MKIEKDIVTNGEILKLENGTIINRFSHVVAGAEIGKNSMIGEHVYVAGKSKIGDYVRIQNTNNIWDGVEIGNNTFVAPAVCFTNDHDPSKRFQREKNHNHDKTIIGEYVTICTGCCIIAPCVISDGAIIAAGSIVLRNLATSEFVKGIVKNK